MPLLILLRACVYRWLVYFEILYGLSPHLRVFDGRKLRLGSSVKAAHLYSFMPLHMLGNIGDTGNDNGTDTTRETGHRSGYSDNSSQSSSSDLSEPDPEELTGEGPLLASSRLRRQLMEIYSEGLRGRRTTITRDPLGDLVSKQYSVTSAVYSANGDGMLALFIEWFPCYLCQADTITES